MDRIKKHVGTHHITSWKVFVFVLSIMAAGVFGSAYSIEAYPQVFKTEIAMENRENVKPLDPIVINFSQPVMTQNYSTGIKVLPETEMEYTWENSGKKLIIMPKNFWRPETQYTLSLPDGKNAMLAGIDAQDITFSTIKFPRVTKIIPEDSAKDVALDIEDPIVVNFDQSTEGFFLKFSLTPDSPMSYKNNEDKTQFKILPQEKIKEGQEYKLVIYAKFSKDTDDNYREIFRSSFSTLPPEPLSWEKDFTARLEQAKRFTKAKIEEGKYIDVNLEAQVLSLFENGKIVMSSMISSGKRGMETTKGEFTIHNKAPRVWSKRYGLYMPYWMAVASDGSFGIHELPEWPGGYKEGANHLGIPVSHGCIRLGVGPAKQAFEWTDVGTPVIIY
ncbi:MAG: L,D-transpeptidase family protein [Parcubacteria group bacterium]|jgi:lipoprotein-anchoring transpeptidase ErfK/SrfK